MTDDSILVRHWRERAEQAEADLLTARREASRNDDRATEQCLSVMRERNEARETVEQLKLRAEQAEVELAILVKKLDHAITISSEYQRRLEQASAMYRAERDLLTEDTRRYVKDVRHWRERAERAEKTLVDERGAMAAVESATVERIVAWLEDINEHTLADAVERGEWRGKEVVP